LKYMKWNMSKNFNERLYEEKMEEFWQDRPKSKNYIYRGAENSLARPGRKQDTTEDFDVHVSFLSS
jgi:hypothetical protein